MNDFKCLLCKGENPHCSWCGDGLLFPETAKPTTPEPLSELETLRDLLNTVRYHVESVAHGSDSKDAIMFLWHVLSEDKSLQEPDGVPSDAWWRTYHDAQYKGGGDDA